MDGEHSAGKGESSMSYIQGSISVWTLPCIHGMLFPTGMVILFKDYVDADIATP